MDIDPQVFLCLLAVRQFGGRSVPAKQDLFTKGLKAPLKTAVDSGWLRSVRAAVQTTDKNGKAKSTKVDMLELTPEGEETLRRAAQPDTLAAVAASQVAFLRERLEADCQGLRAEVLAALADKGKGKKPDAGKEMTALAKTVADLGKRLEKIEAALQGGGSEPILLRIDEAFARLQSRLQQALPAGTATPARPAEHARAPQPTAPTSATGTIVREALRRAYDDLCQLIDFEDRLVPLPRLYHQAHHLMPGLTVAAFQHELQSLWDGRALELQVANDVRDLPEQDKALRRGDNLYYYVLWHQR